MYPRYCSAQEAVQAIQSGQRVFVHGSAATPLTLLHALEKRALELKGVEIVSLSMLGDVGINKAAYAQSFYFNTLFVSKPVRANVNQGNGDYIPVFLSEIHTLFEQDILKPHVALIHVSPPDAHGYCSLGTAVDVAKSGCKNASLVIAQVNPQMPRTHGDGMIHISEIDFMVETHEPLQEVHYSQGEFTEAEQKIGRYVAALIEDGSTLQMGIGNLPNAVLSCLQNHQNLGVHTEMLSDGVLPLLESGVINNKFKHKHRYKTVTSFAVGTQKLYEWVHDNPSFAFLNASYVNDESVIRSNPKVVAINCAIEIDITGQVCADSVGTYQYSGVGGQMDFLRGAALSQGGKPIVAMLSRTRKGESKIVPFLKQGAGVVTTRAHVHYVVTEYGTAYLYGKNLLQRAKALTQIAHPDDREMLEKETFNRFGSL